MRRSSLIVSLIALLAAPVWAAAGAQGRADLAFELPGMTGIVEGIAHHGAADAFFFGDVHHRCVWRRDASGTVARFTSPEARLAGVFGVAVDEPRHRLWCATSMVPEAAGFKAADKGCAALVALDLHSGAVLQSYAPPVDAREHLFGDLLVDGAGTVYVTDSAAPIIWRLPPGAPRLESWVESDAFRSLQGLALIADGAKLVVSDYARGLFAVDVAARTVQPITAPGGAVLRGVDGLLTVDGAVMAVQNGADPERVVRLELSPDAMRVSNVHVLASGVPGLSDLTLITGGRSDAWLVAGSGWASGATAKGGDLPARSVRIYRLGK